MRASHTMKIAISSGGTGGNMGDRAILAATLQDIRESIPDVKITLLSINPDYRSEDKDINMAFGKWETFKTLQSIDLLLWGGGNLLQDQSSILYIPWQLSKVIAAKMFGKKVMCYAQGIGPIETSIGKFLTKLFVNRIDLITVRDEQSKELFKKRGVVKPPIYVTADPAINLKPSDLSA